MILHDRRCVGMNNPALLRGKGGTAIWAEIKALAEAAAEKMALAAAIAVVAAFAMVDAGSKRESSGLMGRSYFIR